MGLPNCGKTTVLESVLKQKIELKDEAELEINHYLNRKRDEKCLSIYDLCALGSTHHTFAWSFATNRYGAIFSILCGLIRRNPCVGGIKFEITSQPPKSVMDKHIRWLQSKTKELLEGIKDDPGKVTLIHDGVSFINAIDVGVNKALYPFLAVMLLHCHRHICLAFFSMNRDGPNLDEYADLPSDRYGGRNDDVLIMKKRSRLTYLLHFATVGYTQQQRNQEEVQNATVMVATRNEPLEDPKRVDQAESLEDPKIVDQAELLEDPKIADQAESLEDPKIVDQAELLEDPKIADQAESLKDPKIVDQAESLEDPKIADQAESLKDPKIVDQAESLEDPKIADQAESLKDPKIVDQAKNKIIKQAESRNVDQFLKNWLEVDVNDERSIEKFGEKMEDLIKYKYKQRTLLLPLRWIVLRSLVVSLDSKGAKVMILRKSFIIQKAIELEMTKKEVDDFLKTFTDFGSILYMPQYEKVEDIVIVNIWEFTQYLDKLYYPQEKEPYAPNLLKYGIISESSVKKIFCKHPESADDFMTVLTTIAMASKIKSGKSIFIDDQQQPDEVHYYLPLARTRAEYTPSEEENDYAFIEIESVNFPANVQACISYAIMDNNKDAVLIATDYSNISRFLFQSESGPPIEIEMIYKGSKTRLRIMNNSNDILTSPATVEACKKVIAGSCRCLDRKINTIRDLKYSFAVPCASPKGGCHFLYYDREPQLCDACSAGNNFRLCWSKAVKQCDLLSKGGEARTNENDLLSFQDISGIITGKYEFEAFKKALNIDERNEDGRKKAMMLMLLLWEKQTDKPTRHALMDKLKENGCDDIAEKLKNTSIAY
uniref:Death domain-containing protein n=1 Tax=Amphimedon queenslandica TaxID=400682 RepID=A0A1X7UV62_AMPQE